MNNHPLKGQVAIVTGGGRGIGLDIAKALAAAGVSVGLVGRNEADLKTAAEQIQSVEGVTLPLVADVTNSDQVNAMAKAASSRLGNVDLLVNNAGILGKPGAWWEMPADAWWRIMEVNLKGAMLCIQAFLPRMLARGRGRIINLSSNAGLAPVPEMGPYAVSKAALVRLTDSLHTDINGRGVSVFAVSPGLVKTDLSRGLPTFAQIPEAQWCSPGRVAELFTIAGGRADALSGRYLHVDDDVEALIANADRIVAADAHTLRLRREF